MAVIGLHIGKNLQNSVSLVPHAKDRIGYSLPKVTYYPKTKSSQSSLITILFRNHFSTSIRITNNKSIASSNFHSILVFTRVYRIYRRLYIRWLYETFSYPRILSFLLWHLLLSSSATVSFILIYSNSSSAIFLNESNLSLFWSASLLDAIKCTVKEVLSFLTPQPLKSIAALMPTCQGFYHIASQSTKLHEYTPGHRFPVLSPK